MEWSVAVRPRMELNVSGVYRTREAISLHIRLARALQNCLSVADQEARVSHTVNVVSRCRRLIVGQIRLLHLESGIAGSHNPAMCLQYTIAYRHLCA